MQHTKNKIVAKKSYQHMAKIFGISVLLPREKLHYCDILLNVK